MDALIIGLVAVAFFVAGYMVKRFKEKDHTSKEIPGGGGIGEHKPNEPEVQ